MSATMTKEQYEDKRRRIEANLVDAKKALTAARAYYDGLCDDLRNLRIDWREQHRATTTEQ